MFQSPPTQICSWKSLWITINQYKKSLQFSHPTRVSWDFLLHDRPIHYELRSLPVPTWYSGKPCSRRLAVHSDRSLGKSAVGFFDWDLVKCLGKPCENTTNYGKTMGKWWFNEFNGDLVGFSHFHGIYPPVIEGGNWKIPALNGEINRKISYFYGPFSS